MKTLPLLVLCRRAGSDRQDAECVRERAAMVETIRTYADPTLVFWDSRVVSLWIDGSCAPKRTRAMLN
jgi:hypothetical protein